MAKLLVGEETILVGSVAHRIVQMSEGVKAVVQMLRPCQGGFEKGF